jgi:hypothetical protein
MNRAPSSTEALDLLIAALQEIRDGYLLDERRFDDPPRGGDRSDPGLREETGRPVSARVRCWPSVTRSPLN